MVERLSYKKNPLKNFATSEMEISPLFCISPRATKIRINLPTFQAFGVIIPLRIYAVGKLLVDNRSGGE